MKLSTVAAFKHIRIKEGMVEVKGEKLKQLQAHLTEMVRNINIMCQENGITYTLSGGTCLGAIRHHGFIPWDDDVDLNMPRKDWEKFVTVIKEKYADRYTIHIPGETPDYELCFGRVRERNTLLRCREDFNMPDEECGVYVDIFIMDNVPNSKLMRYLHGFVSMALGFALSCRRFTANLNDYLFLADDNKELISIFKKKARIGILFSFLSVNAWIKAWDKWNALLKNKKTKYVSIPVGRKHYFEETQPTENFLPVSWGDFEGIKVPIPANPEPYMTSLYGPDYMTPPPEAERETHVVLAFELEDNNSNGSDMPTIDNQLR